MTDKDASALYGKLSHGEYGLFLTLDSYSPACRSFEQGKGNLRLIDGDELVDSVFAHYEQFDSRHKGLLPCAASTCRSCWRGRLTGQGGESPLSRKKLGVPIWYQAKLTGVRIDASLQRGHRHGPRNIWQCLDLELIVDYRRNRSSSESPEATTAVEPLCCKPQLPSAN